MTNRVSFFPPYKLLNCPEENVENKVLKLEADYSTPIILLVDLYYDLFQQSKAIDTDNNILSSLLAIESRLHYVKKTYSKEIQAPSEYWRKNAMNDEGSPMWSVCYGYILFHGCRSLLHRMHIHHRFRDDEKISKLDLEPNATSAKQLSDFQHHFDICCESAELITTFCRSLIRHGTMTMKTLPTQFLMPLLQSSSIHILLAFIEHSSDESDKYRKIMKNVELNLTFIGWYFTKQAHNRIIFETMKNLYEEIFAMDKNKNSNAIRMAFSIVYQTMNEVIPSIFSKNFLDITIAKEQI